MVMFSAAALFTIAKSWKQLKCPLVDEYINKMLYEAYNRNYFVQEMEVLIHATEWRDFENIMPSKISQTPKD